MQRLFACIDGQGMQRRKHFSSRDIDNHRVLRHSDPTLFVFSLVFSSNPLSDETRAQREKGARLIGCDSGLSIFVATLPSCV